VRSASRALERFARKFYEASLERHRESLGSVEALLDRIYRFAGKPAISPNIFSGDDFVHSSRQKAIGHHSVTLRSFSGAGRRYVRYRTFYSTSRGNKSTLIRGDALKY
jgi:hypothetical protein